MSLQDDYRRLLRLRTKRARLDKHIQVLAKKLAGYKGRWGNCSYRRNRK